jgi:hypothetical protein
MTVYSCVLRWMFFCLLNSICALQAFGICFRCLWLRDSDIIGKITRRKQQRKTTEGEKRAATGECSSSRLPMPFGFMASSQAGDNAMLRHIISSTSTKKKKKATLQKCGKNNNKEIRDDLVYQLSSRASKDAYKHTHSETLHIRALKRVGGWYTVARQLSNRLRYKVKQPSTIPNNL